MCKDEMAKKKYLRQYMPYVIAVKEIEQSLHIIEKEIRELLKQIDVNTLESYTERLKRIRSMLIRKRIQKMSVYFEIYQKVEKIEDETEKCLLRLKYLNGYSWENVADELGYSIRQIHNIHKKSLANLKL